MDAELRVKAIALLDQLLIRDMTSEEVNLFIGAIPGNVDREIRLAIEAAFHFATDDDIRTREPEYDLQLRDDLRDRLVRLKSA